MRRTLLAELGRLRDPEVIRETALELCERRPKTADGVLWVRRMRTGIRPQPDADRLANQICRLLDSYCSAHPGTGKQDMLAALKIACDAVERAEVVE